MDGVLIGPHLTGGHVVPLLVGGDAGHRDAAHGVLVVPGFHMDGKAAHTGGRVICVYLCCAVSVGVVGHLDGVARHVSLRIGQLRVVEHGQGQIGLDGVIQLFCNGIVGVLFFLALVVLSVVQHIPQGKLRFTGLVGGREVPGGHLAPGGNGFAQTPIALLQGDRIAGREGFAVLGGRGGIGHVAAADGGGGAEGDLQLVPAIHISGRDGVADAVVPEFLRADLFPADVYFAHDLYALRQIILDHIAHKEVAGDDRIGHTDRDLPLDLAILRLVLALLGDARLLHGQRLKVAGILQIVYIGHRTVDDDAGAVFRVVEGSAVEQHRVAPEILFACIQGREVFNFNGLGVRSFRQSVRREGRLLCQRPLGIHLVKNKAVCNISAQQLIHLAISFVQGIGDGHRIFGAIRGLNADHIVHLEGAVGQILHQWLFDARIAAVAVICRAELVEDHIRFFRFDGQDAVVLEFDLLLVLKVVGARRNGGLEGTGEWQAALLVGADELFVRKGQGHFAVGVDVISAHDLCIVGLVLVGLIHDVALHHIRHGQAFGQLVGQGIVVGRQHTGFHGILQVHADAGAAFHGHAARADRRPCFPVGRLFIIDIRDPGVQIMVVPGSQQGDAVGVGVTHPVHGGTKAILIFQQRIAAVQLLLGACRVLRGHSGGLGGIGAGHRDDTGHVGHGSGHLGHLAVHVAGDHGQGPGVGVHGGHDAHRLGGHGAGVHLRLGSRELGGGVGVLVQIQQGDAIGALVHGHLLGGEGVVDDDIAGPCGGAVGVGEPLGAAQVTVQGHHARTLGHHRLGHTRKVQAVGQEHHVPGAVGVAVPGTIAGVAAQHLLVLHIQLEVLVALLVVQLGLCHGEQVLGPVAVQGHVGRGLPFLGSLHVGLGIGQALHGVVVLRDGAHQLLGVAGVGVVMQHRLLRDGLGRLSGQVHHGAAGRHFLIGGVGFLHQFAFVQAAHQLILGGVAAVVVDMFELAADERTVLVKAVVGVLVLFLTAGQHPVLLVAGIGVLMGHPDGLRLGLHRLFRLSRAVGGHRIGAAVRRGDGRFRLALLVTAGEHFFVAGRRVLVLLVAAVVVGSHGDAHPMELPVDEQGGEQGQHQHHGHIAPGLYMLPAEPLDQPVDDILHSKHVLLVRSVPWQPHTAAGPQRVRLSFVQQKRHKICSIHCHYTILRRSFQLRGACFSGKRMHTMRTMQGVRGSHSTVQPRLNRVWALAICRASTALSGPWGETSRTSAVNWGSSSQHTAAPDRLNRAWAAARRLASRLCPTDASTAVTVVPMLSPNSTGMAPARPSRHPPSGPGRAATCCSTAMVAELLCTARVMPSPASRPRPGRCRTWAIHCRNTGPAANGSMASAMTAMPSNSRPNANSACPAACRRPRPANQSSSPATSSRYRASSSRKASNCAVTVVPMLAPNTTGTARCRVSSPAPTRPSTSTVTAELLCTTAVTAAPVSTPASGWAVSRARACRRVSPAACCKASVRVSILYKKSAAPPNNCRIIHKRCSMPDAPLCFMCMRDTNVCELL